ncbi:MAG: hypothetical protein JWO07_19 [Candidatus Saccharibacteria bacterium]|nr:hypothetical protein [Candidatus Saccharibacteria bacterium]
MSRLFHNLIQVIQSRRFAVCPCYSDDFQVFCRVAVASPNQPNTTLSIAFFNLVDRTLWQDPAHSLYKQLFHAPILPSRSRRYDSDMNIVTLDQAIPLLQNGAIGVVPTDTVYGLVTIAADHAAVHRFYTLKSREKKPGTLIASSTDQLLALSVSPTEIEKVVHYWPNPLSAVLPVPDNTYLHQGVGTLAMRVVADPTIKQFLEQTGPLITSSANQPGQPPATNISEAAAYFGDSIDFYVDGGTIDQKLPSTIIRPTHDGIEVLRQGSISV